MIGALSAAGELLGFASYGLFRGWPAYKYSVEHSVYVAAASRGRGIGRRLSRGNRRGGRGQNYHLLIAGIDSQNAVSIALHRAMGFRRAGTIFKWASNLADGWTSTYTN